MYAGLTPADKTALLDAKANGMVWIARDWNDSLYGYIDKPQRNGDSRWFTDGAFYSGISDSSLSFVQWNNDAPVNIDLAIAQIAEMESDLTANSMPMTWNERINQMTAEGKGEFFAMFNCPISLQSEYDCSKHANCIECMTAFFASPYTEGEKK